MDTIDEYTAKAWIFIICSGIAFIIIGTMNAGTI